MIRKESQRQSKPKVAAKANPKQRRSKEKGSSVKKPVVIEVEDDSPSGEILSSQDSLEESSASSQDSLQSIRCAYFRLFCYITLILNFGGGEAPTCCFYSSVFSFIISKGWFLELLIACENNQVIMIM